MAAVDERRKRPAFFAPERWLAWLPWLGILAWTAGGVLLWYLCKSYFGLSLSAQVFVGCGWLFVLALVAHNAVRNMFGPVFMYEVIRLGRRRLTFIMRLLYVLGIMALLSIMYLAWLDSVGYFDRYSSERVPYERLNSFATDFFYTFLAVQFGVLAFLTPAYVAGTVADEKERKTLEFLLATDLKNREIIFGKLAARVTNLLMFVLAGLPVVAFMQLFGGIDPDQLLAGIAATVITVIGLSAVSVYFSTTLRKPRDAIAMTYLFVAVYIVVSFVLGWYLIYLQFLIARTGSTPIVVGDTEICDTLDIVNAVKLATDWICAGNLAYVLTSTFNPMTGAGLTTDSIGTALFRYAAFWGLVTVALVGYSVARLRTIALSQGPGGSAPKKARVSRRVAMTRPGIGNDPMFWKEVFVDGGVRGGCMGWAVSIIISALIFVIPIIILWNTLIDPPNYVYYGNQSYTQRWDDFARGMNLWCRIATGVLGFLTMLAAAVRGAGSVSGERDRDTWISLISTPLTAWEMLRGKWLGCVLGLRRAYGVLIVVWALSLLVGAVDPPMMLATVICTIVYISAFAWIGIYCSITARTTLIATVRALMISMFMAGGFWIFLGLCCAMPLSMMYRGQDSYWLQDVEQVILGWTPPFVMGWMPLMNYERQDMGPFGEDSYRGSIVGIGPFSPVLGVLGWIGIGAFFAMLSWNAFQKLSNRAPDKLGARLPRPRQQPEPRPQRKPRELPIAKPKRVAPKPHDGDEPIILPDDDRDPKLS